MDLQEKFDMFDAGIPGKPLRCKTTLAAGNLFIGHVGGFGGQWELVPFGETLTELAQYASCTDPGHVLLTPKCKDLWTFVEMNPSDSSQMPSFSLQPPMYEDNIGDELAASSYVPSAGKLISAISTEEEELALSQIRTLAVCFVNFSQGNESERESFADREFEWLQDVHAMVRRLQEVMLAYDGCLRQVIKDDKGGVTAIFLWGVPGNDHEDNAYRACAAALKMEQALRQNEYVPKIGVTQGEAICGTIGTSERCEYSATGATVNLAARLMTANGLDGGVLCSSDVRDMASMPFGIVGFDHVGLLSVKGRPEPIEAYTCVQREPLSVHKEESGGILEHVYSRQLVYLQGKLRDFEKMEHPQMACITGEALFGKTVLLERFLNSLNTGDDAHRIVLKWSNPASAGGRAFWERLLSLAFGKSGIEDVQAGLKLIDAKAENDWSFIVPADSMSSTLGSYILPQVTPCYQALLPLVAKEGLGIDCEETEVTFDLPIGARKRILAEVVMTAVVLLLLDQGALLLAIDDVDKAETDAWFLLRSLVKFRQIPLFIVMTMQTVDGKLSNEQRELLRANIEVSGSEEVSMLPLERLDNAQCCEHLKAYMLGENASSEVWTSTGSRTSSISPSSKENDTTRMSLVSVRERTTVDDHLVQFIMHHSDGNPIFAMKVVQMMSALGMLRVSSRRAIIKLDDEHTGKLRVSKLLPLSVSAMTRATLDKLQPKAQTVARIASAIGVEWEFDEVKSVLAKVSTINDGDLEDCVSELLQAGVVRRIAGTMWSFHGHAQCRVVYETLPIRERYRLHGLVADTLKSLPTLDGQRRTKSFRSVLFGRIARQLQLGGQTRESFLKFKESAREALRENALREAKASCEKAVELVETTFSTSLEKAKQRADLMSLSAETAFREGTNFHGAFQWSSDSWEQSKIVLRQMTRPKRNAVGHCCLPNGKTQKRVWEEELAKSTELRSLGETVVESGILLLKHSMFAQRTSVGMAALAKLASRASTLSMFTPDHERALAQLRECFVRAKARVSQPKSRISGQAGGVERCSAPVEAFIWFVRGQVAAPDWRRMDECFKRAIELSGADEVLVRCANLHLRLVKVWVGGEGGCARGQSNDSSSKKKLVEER